MGPRFSVKLLLSTGAAVAMWFTSAAAFAADAMPDGRELLHNARMMQSSQEWQLLGQVRMGSAKTPLRLTLDSGAIRYEFLDNGDTITLKLGEKGSTLEESRGGKAAKVTPARFD